MRKVLSRYDSIRGRDPADQSQAFWDIVIISAADPDQEFWYQEQLEMKQQMGDLPRRVPFIPISDPPGPRIGSGGSTLHILDQLVTR